jgi:hypothetical protein
MGTLVSSGTVTFADGTTRFKLDLTGISRSTLELGGTQSYTVISAPGGVTVGTGSLSSTNIDLVNNTGGFIPGDWSLLQGSNQVQLVFTPTVIPEPATIFGLGTVALGFAGWIRRRRK